MVQPNVSCENDHFQHTYDALYTSNTEDDRKNILMRFRNDCNRKVVQLELAKICFDKKNLDLLKLVKEVYQIDHFPKEWMFSGPINPVRTWLSSFVNGWDLDEMVEEGQLEYVKLFFERSEQHSTTISKLLLFKLHDGLVRNPSRAEEYCSLLLFLTQRVPQFDPDHEDCDMFVINHLIELCYFSKEEISLEIVKLLIHHYRKPIEEFYRKNKDCAENLQKIKVHFNLSF